MTTYEAHFVSMNEENLMTLHLRIGEFESNEELFKYVETMEVDPELLKIKNLQLAVAEKHATCNQNDSDHKVNCSEHGDVPALNIRLYQLGTESNNTQSI